MSKVLVVLLNFNSPDDTYRCLKSLAESSLHPEVVLVDNASSGDGLIIADKVRAAYANTHVIFNPSNDGFGGGNNVGIEWGLKHSEADYFFILNNDTVVPSESIERLMSYLESNPKMGMCSPAIFHLKTPEVFWFGGGYIDWAKGGAFSPNINRKLGTEVKVEKNTFISGCAMLVRRDVLEKIGGFSEDYFMYCEDVDFCERVMRAGYQIGYDPTTRIFHNAHSSLVRGHDAYITPFSWKNKSAPFFVKHYVYGALLNLSKYAQGLKFISGVSYVAGRCIKWSISYLLHHRFDGVKGVLQGLLGFLVRRFPQ